MTLITLLVVLLVACVVIWAADKLTKAFEIADPIRTVLLVIVILVVLVWILRHFAPGLVF